MPKIVLSERFKRPPWFLSYESYLRPEDNPISSHPEARDNRIVPLVIADYGNTLARLKQIRYIGRQLAGAIKEMRISAKSVRANPYTGNTTIDADTLHELETYAYSLGITDIGYTQINTRYIFKRFKILYPNAIVFTMAMDKEKIKQAPAIPSFIEIFRTYYELGVVVNKVADFLRERGFNASAQPAIGGDINMIPVAIDAGLGYSGKNGLLITEANGPRVRLAAVVTDIENLPFAEDNPFHWVRDYCESCNNCVQHCPADAIHMKTITHDDDGPIFIDYTKCAVPFSNDNGCTLCIKFCPFSYSEYDHLKTQFELKQ
ncbi:MAG: 4Fe-4S binding protein [Anaerolineae bacterium]|nr:4Fe-4S binding protein [Anaerolineae bacterium]